MTEKPTILAVIAARAGSKGLPGKNVLDCAGKPLIAWTIEAALASAAVDRVLVSTDSEEIAAVAEAHGAWVPFLRSAELAEDDSGIVDVIKDVLARLREQSLEFDYVLLLQPTSPLRTTVHIDEAIAKYFSTRTSDDDTLVSVKTVDSKVLWVLGEDERSGYVFNHYGMDLSDNARRQDLPRCYAPNGAIYLARSAGFNGFYGPHTRAYVMTAAASIDVDYQEDLDRAARMLTEQTLS
mgnify:CR=1 FL=1